MKIKNRGFTLIEVIIAMAIMTSIIFIGYQVINKTDILRRDQILVSNIQNGTNNLKRYITKELKESKSVYVKYGEKKIDLKKSDDVNNLYKSIQNEINNRDDIEYKYIINTKDKEINYIVQVIKDRSKKVYSIYRQEQKASFSLIEKQPLSNNMIPLKITEKDSLYDVQLNYIKDNTKVYSFDVYNSLLAYSDENINKPTDPENPVSGHNYLSYCMQKINYEYNYIIDNIFNDGFDKKLKDSIYNEVNKLDSLTDYNPPKDKDIVYKLFNTMGYKFSQFRTSPSEQLMRAFNELNRLEYYIKAGKLTAYYIKEDKYIINDKDEIHNFVQHKVEPEISNGANSAYNIGLQDVYTTLHDYLGGEFLQIKQNINSMRNNFNPNDDITKETVHKINNLIDIIIEQQINIKDEMRLSPNGKSKYKGSGKFILSSDGDEALRYLDKAKEDLIKVKYMLGQTNYHRQQ